MYSITEHRTRLVFGGALVFLLLVGAAAQVTFRALRRSTELVRHTNQVLSTLDSLNVSVLRMGWVQRGYLLSGNSAQLEKFPATVVAAGKLISQLRFLTQDNPGQQDWVDSLEVLVSERIAAVDSVVISRRRDGFERSLQAWNLALGLQPQDEISRVAGEMQIAERALLVSRTGALKSRMNWAYLLALAGSVAALLLTALAAMLIRRDFSRARAATEALRQANLDLDARVQARNAELLRANEALRTSGREFRLKLESLPHLVWTCESDGRYSYLSPQWVEFTGVPEVEQLGDRWLEAVHPGDRSQLRDAWAGSLASGVDLRAEYRIRRHDGVYHWFDGRAVALRDDADRIVRWFGSSTDVQEAREARESLARERERIETIAAVSPAVLHSFRLGPEGEMSFPFAAPRVGEVYGIDGSGLEQDAGPALALIHPEDVGLIRTTLIDSARELSTWHQCWRVRHPVRGEIWVEGYLTPRRESDGGTVWHGVLMDVSERIRAEAALRASEERLQTIIDGLSEGLVVSDLEGKLLHFNPAAAAMHGFTGEADWQLRLPDFFQIFELSIPDGEVLPLDQWPLARVLAGETLQNWEVRIRRRTGQWERIFNYGGHLLQQPGGTVLAVVTMADVTERHAVTAQLEGRTTELSRSNRDLEQFANIASHDLREPLRAVSGCVQLLQNRYRGQLDGRADELIGHAVDGSARMQRLIDDLLAFSRLATRPPRPEPTDCGEALGEALANLRTAIQESGAVVDTGPLPPLTVDRGQLISLLQNLVGNALKFHGTAPPRIEVRAIRRSQSSIISIRDNGIGIEPQYFDRIFGIFQRLHTRVEYPGTGMGLAMCKKIVEQADGRIWLESAPGAGTTFFMAFPLAHPALSPPPRVPA